MSRAERIKGCRLAGGTFFNPDLQALYLTYDTLSHVYTGWTLGDLKGLTYRERQYWQSLHKWRKEKSGLGT